MADRENNGRNKPQNEKQVTHLGVIAGLAINKDELLNYWWLRRVPPPMRHYAPPEPQEWHHIAEDRRKPVSKPHLLDFRLLEQRRYSNE